MFIINWGDTEERLDAIYYSVKNSLNIVKNTKLPVKKLKDVVSMQRGRFGHRPRNDPRYYDGQYPFIQTGNIVSASEDNAAIKYTQTLNELGLSTSRLCSEKSLLITIAANIGYTAILDYDACFPDSIIALKPRKTDVTIEYLNIYIRHIRRYIEDLAPQAAQKNINIQQLSPVPIIVPRLKIQQQIVDIMDAAYEEKRQKEKQAKNLLDSISNYLLGELGITMPLEEENILESRKFYVHSSKVIGSRFDPYYHKPIFETNLRHIANCNNETILLRNAIEDNLVKGILPNDAQKDGEFKVIQIKNINSDGTVDIDSNITSKPIYSTKHQLQIGDVLVVITGATIGKIGLWEHDLEFYLGGDIVKFNTGNLYLNEIYAALLRTVPYQMQIKRCITGATNGHLAPLDIELLMLPIIKSEDVQKRIAKHLRSVRSNAKKLQDEAKEIVSIAKTKVEKILLEGNL